MRHVLILVALILMTEVTVRAFGHSKPPKRPVAPTEEEAKEERYLVNELTIQINRGEIPEALETRFKELRAFRQQRVMLRVRQELKDFRVTKENILAFYQFRFTDRVASALVNANAEELADLAGKIGPVLKRVSEEERDSFKLHLRLAYIESKWPKVLMTDNDRRYYSRKLETELTDAEKKLVAFAKVSAENYADKMYSVLTQ